MQVQETVILGVLLLTPRRYGDDRGWFSETWNLAHMDEAGIDLVFVQDNHSFSKEAGTLRGLHYQSSPRAQDKLVRCTRGAIFDVAVDVRRGSPTFGKWVGVDLTAQNGCQLLVPKGFLHGFVTREPETEVQYKVTDTYAADHDGSVRWDSLDIDWGLDTTPVLSHKDEAALAFGDWQSPFSMSEGA